MNRIGVLFFGSFLISAYSFGQSYEEALRLVQAKIQTINDYQCTFISFASNGEDSEKITYRYYFKKPASVRMEIQTGEYEGTILLYTGGDVRVKLGHGILSWFSFTFKRTNKIVCDLRGNGIHQSDWGWFIEQHQQMIPLAQTTRSGIDTIDGRQLLYYELVSKNPEQTRSIAKEQIWIDQQENTLLQYKQFDLSGKLIQSGLYKDVVVNVKINDKIFTEFDKQE